MRFESLVIVVFLFFGISKVTAQNYELGKVTITELKEKSNLKDTTAPAAILFKKGRTFFSFNKDKGFSANHVYEFKIKIYKKEGLKWADQKVRFYIGYETLSEDRLEFSNAVTYNLENGAIVKTKLDNQGTFKKKINKFWNEKTITLPNVKVGSIIEYKYILKSENIVKLPNFDFQYEIPVNYFEYKTDIPEYYIYKPILVGGHKIETDSKLTNTNQSFEDNYNRSSSISYKQISAFYIGKDIPALTIEPYINNIDNYRGSIQHELERVRYPDQPVKDYSLTWEGVATTIFKDKTFGKELDEKDFLLEDVKRLLTNVDSKNERLNIIFKFVQNKMNWNEVNDYYTDKGVVKAYADQTGNVAEINFILITMLRMGGIAVNPVLVSTIENGVPVYPTRTGFNYVIAAAEIDGKQILLDATHKFTCPGTLPLNVLNWNGRLIKEDGTSTEINLVPSTTSKELYSIMVKMDNLGKIEGKIRLQRTDYNAYRFRIENANKSQENYLEKLEEQLGDLKISNYTIENMKANFPEPVSETFSFVSDNSVEIIGGKMFVNPLLFFTRTKNSFNQETRQMPISLGYPTHEKFNLNLQIPEGYVIESLPSSIRVSSEDKQIIYLLNISGEGNKIQISSSKEINNSIFAAESYNGLKELFQKVIVSQNEKIVLKKI
ncbi:uncharacterized protein DUF3857 [Flavobacterium araucananum]|uniref:DUF3857 domain-containing protein n=1 Tax=Flavobacterium araucananum TaxID=946678 RepID=A0A227P4Y7_9FLAO|nr:DUF3857 domain-containing protein [Flavobacterium araucananum]OXG04969.1 hypothetical protein B0A64_14105 [Flavobacterium araucananum]PWK01974.1 uncharacterized protein DUF3857 [Flavobacterium araucananum]